MISLISNLPRLSRARLASPTGGAVGRTMRSRISPPYSTHCIVLALDTADGAGAAEWDPRTSTSRRFCPARQHGDVVLDSPNARVFCKWTPSTHMYHTQHTHTHIREVLLPNADVRLSPPKKYAGNTPERATPPRSSPSKTLTSSRSWRWRRRRTAPRRPTSSCLATLTSPPRTSDEVEGGR